MKKEIKKGNYKKSFKVEANSVIKIKGLNRDMYNDILPFIKQMKYKSTGREIILYDGSEYISLSADFVIHTLLSKVNNIEKEIGELRKVD